MLEKCIKELGYTEEDKKENSYYLADSKVSQYGSQTPFALMTKLMVKRIFHGLL